MTWFEGFEILDFIQNELEQRGPSACEDQVRLVGGEHVVEFKAGGKLLRCVSRGDPHETAARRCWKPSATLPAFPEASRPDAHTPAPAAMSCSPSAIVRA